MDVLVRIGADEWLLSLAPAATVRPGPFPMPRCDLTLAFDAAAWPRFTAMEPGWHDLMALRRQGALAVSGDIRLFFAHLAALKALFARAQHVSARPVPTALQAGLEPILGRYLNLELEGLPHRLYFEEAGQGRPLILLHTAGSDGRQWRHLLNDREVTASFRCIAFDMPWHGKSSPPAEATEYRLTAAAYTGMVLTIAAALGAERPVVMGCSIGGRIVLDLAAEHADALHGVVGLQGSAFVAPYYDTAFLDHPEVHGGRACAAVVSGLCAPTSPDAAETLWHYAQGGPGVFRGDLHFYKEDGDLRGKLARIDTARCPVWLLTGEYDYSCRPEDTLATAAAIPGAQARILPGLGHFPMSEDYAALKPHLMEALRALA